MKNLILLIAITSFGMISLAQNTTRPTISELLEGEWKLQTEWGANPMEFTLMEDSEKNPENYSIKNTIQFDTDGNVIKRTYGTFGCGTAYVMNLRLIDTKWNYTNGKLHIKGDFRDYRGEHFLDAYYEIIRESNRLMLSQINR
jgi:hypothetical protein